MASLFSKPKSPTLPPVPPPPPVPVIEDDTADDAARAAKRRSGFKKTIITGDLEPNTGKKTLLGD